LRLGDKNTRQVGVAAPVMVLLRFANPLSAASSAGWGRQRRSSMFVRHLPAAGRLSNYLASATLRPNAKVYRG